ncbi:10306_t:CDS:2, partial [Gigaspora margarita]
DIEETLSAAITSLYNRLFLNSNTKFSGLYILGWNDKDLLNSSLKGVEFRLFAFKVEKYLVQVINVEIENNSDLMGTGIGYMSSFIGEYNKKQALFIQIYEFWSQALIP